MNPTLARMFGPEWITVRSTVIDEKEMHMGHDICKLLGLSSTTVAIKGAAGTWNVSPEHRTMELVEEWNKFRTVHLLSTEGVFQLILNNKSPECRRIKAYMARNALMQMSYSFRYQSDDM